MARLKRPALLGKLVGLPYNSFVKLECRVTPGAAQQDNCTSTSYVHCILGLLAPGGPTMMTFWQDSQSQKDSSVRTTCSDIRRVHQVEG